MELKTFFAQDLTGRAISNPLVFIYQVGTQVYVNGLTGANGESLTNPFSGNAIGKITVALPGGEYDMRILSSIREYTVRVRFIDEDTVADGSKFVDIANEQRDAAFGKRGEVLDVVGSADELRDVLGEVRASAGQAKGSVALADMVLSNNRAIEESKANAAVQASLAEGYAANASSVVPLDLSGVTSEALHRSPNAVTAMFVYDTSKDSDGGAWTERCQGTSWYNEPVMGKWLGAQPSETNARNEGATLGSELVTNGTFDSDTTGWGSVNATISAVSGVLRVTKTAANGQARTTVPTVIGKVYRATATLANRSVVAPWTPVLDIGTSAGGTQYTRAIVANVGVVSGSVTVYFTATAITAYVSLFSGEGTGFEEWDNISVREVISQTTQSGDYFQLTTDGKFYRLWKNLLSYSNEFINSAWSKSAGFSVTSTNTIVSGYQLNTILATTTGCYTFRTVAVGGGTRTMQFKASAGTCDIVGFWENSKYNEIGKFNLTTGIATKTTPQSDASVSMESLGDGVWLCKATFVTTVNPVLYFYPRAYNASTIGDTVNIGQVQLEYGSATAYEPKGPEGAISEVFRGNKRSFPKLVGIVCENPASSTGNVTIYDLTEPGRPMFMRFANFGGSAESSTPHWSYRFTTGVTGVAAANSVIGLTRSGNGGGVTLANFALDKLIIYRTANTYHGIPCREDIASRNTLDQKSAVVNPIVAGAGNAVAMTVLPDAPIDPVTGLKVPTIAVATAGGVSVIKHNGTVVNSADTFAFTLISLNQNTLLVGTGSNFIRFALAPGNLGGAFSLTAVAPSTPGSLSFGNNISNVVPTGTNSLVARGGAIAVAQRFNRSTAARSSEAVITNIFNTGHLIGDIRRAYLSDVDVGSAGPSIELIVDGGFDDVENLTENWSPSTTGSVNLLGQLEFTAGASYTFRSKYVNTIAGKIYKVQATKVKGFTYSYARVYNSANAPFAQFDWYGNFTAVKTFIGTGQPVYFTVVANSDSVAAAYDNISIQEVVADRSYKAQAASITGTLTRSQVAQAAQLVAYSGFSSENYLREPYSADLDFGTGEWNASAWVNVPAVSNNYPTSGANLISNGDLEVDASGWTLVSGVWDATQTLRMQGNWWWAAYPISVVAGKTYKIKVQLTNSTGLTIKIGGSAGSNNIATPYNVGSHAAGTEVSALYTAGSTGIVYVTYSDWGGGGPLQYLDDASVFEVVNSSIADRAFSFGPKLNLGVTGTGRLTVTAFDGTTTRTVTTTAAYNTATWLKAEANYTTNGKLAILVNGVEVASTTGTPLLSLNSRYNGAQATREFDHSYWTKVNATVTRNYAQAPDGSITANQLVASAISGSHALRLKVSNSAGVSERISIYVKGDTSNNLRLSLYGSGNEAARVNLASGSVVSNSLGSLITSFSVTPAANDFYKIAFINNNTSGQLIDLEIENAAGAKSYVGAGEAILVWGADIRRPALAALPDQQVSIGASDFDFAAPLTIGNSYNLDAPFPGSIALLKLSATVPTPEQSIWMYEQEKQMFREGAQVTLPDSGNITDLAYDDASDTWIASSATNISEFSGLVRTNVTPVPAGSFTKLAVTSGVRLHARSTTNPGVDVTIPSIELRTELAKRAEYAAKLNAEVATFDFDSITGQTDFALPTGYSAIAVRVSGERRREGATKDFTRLFDGFKETIRFGVAPGNAVWVQIKATKSIN